MAIRKKAPAPKPAAKDAHAKRLKNLHELGDLFGRWERPSVVFTPIRAVQTIFPALDVALGCGGLPLERFVLVHGPAGGGKTQLGIGLGLSFIRAGHPFALQEPESTTPLEFLGSLMAEQIDSPLFVASRPPTYEVAVDDVRSFCEGVAKGREKGKLPKNCGGLIVCDSISKLVPKSLLDKLLDAGAEKEGVDGLNGGAGRYIAALNSQWCRELTGLLYRTGCSFIAIARERVNMQKFGYGPAYSVPGGVDLVFESSLRLRVTRKPLKVGSKIVGSRHEVKILKTKVADGTLETVDAFFHTANGEDGSPTGFDRARDVWELGLETKAIKRFKRGGKVGYETSEGEVLPDDVEANIAKLREDVPMRDAIETKCRELGRTSSGGRSENDES